MIYLDALRGITPQKILIDFHMLHVLCNLESMTKLEGRV